MAAVLRVSGQQVGPYRIVELLGEGGMGRVYRAEHAETGATVALKTAKHLSPSRTLALRMEVAALRAIEHPGVVRILDEGIESGTPWYAMELLSGETLAVHLRGLVDAPEQPDESVTRTRNAVTIDITTDEGFPVGAPRITAPERQTDPDSLRAILRLYRRLCEPLAHIHGHGIVHRDLKPANVFVRDDGQVVLMDFGLFSYATGAIGREILDAGERAIGTLRYVAPERITGRLVDARADLYAFGCMLYESLTGRTPFEGTPAEVLAQHTTAEPVAPSTIRPDIPRSLEELVLALLEKVPQRRIGHVTDVAARLDEILGDAPASTVGAGLQLYRPELSGRAEVLELLEEHAARVCAGNGSFVLLRGESGIGKTFVASEFAFRAARAGCLVVTGQCLPVTGDAQPASDAQAEPLHPLRRLFQALADACHERARAEGHRRKRTWAPALAPFEPALADFADERVLVAPLVGAAGQERILASILDGLRELAADPPLILILDDLQWADDGTLSFIESLNESFLADLPLLVLGTARSDEAGERLRALAGSSVCTNVMMSHLSAAAATSMIADMLAVAAPSEQLVRFLLRQSEGNPFFIAEYLRYLIGAGHLTKLASGWSFSSRAAEDSLHSPSSIQELVLKRLDTLDQATRRVVSAAAVLGRSFDLELLSTVLGADDAAVLVWVREAQDRVVFEASDDAFRFAHDKLREAAYFAEPEQSRKDWHGRAAVALDERQKRATDGATGTAEIARHYRLAGDLPKALMLFEQAGDEAVAKSAQLHAISAFQAALQLADYVGGVSAFRRARWQRVIGAALQESGEFVRAEQHLREALRLLGQRLPADETIALPLSVMRVISIQVAHRLRRPKPRPSDDESAHLLEAVRAFDRLQQVFYYTGVGLPMLHACVSMLNLAERAAPSPELTVAYANASAVAGVIPARALVEVYRRRTRESMQAAPDPAAETYYYVLTGVYQTGIGAWDAALATFEQGLDTAQRLQYARRIREFTGALGVLWFLRGEFERAKVLAEKLLSRAVQQDAQNHAWALLSRAQVQLVQGLVQSAHDDLSAVSPLLPTLGRPERLWSKCLSAAAHHRAGDWARADELTRAALEDLVATPPVTHYTIDAAARCAELRVRLLRQDSQRGDGQRLQDNALRILRDYARVFPVAQSRYHLVRGFEQMTRRRRAALSAFRRSLTLATRYELRYDEARARLALASLLPAGDARVHHERAQEILTRLGAELVAASPPSA